MLSPTRALTLQEARTIISRAVDKAEELHQAGSFVVVDDAGNVVSASRMDGAGPVGMPLSRAKAYMAGANREPSARFAQRVGSMFVGIYMAYEAVLRDKVFPGPGALPIFKDGQVVGGLSTGASIGPYLKFEGVAPSRFLVNGQAANAEDLIICYALGVPYQPQHGDDTKRFTEAYGFPPSEVGESLGFSESPPARRSPALQQAARLADRAMRRAGVLGEQVAVTITDRHGEILQQDRMDGAAPMTPDVSAAKAATAVNFRRDTAEVADLVRQHPELMHLGQAARFTLLPVAGGLPIFADGRLDGAIGVSGATPEHERDIAAAALQEDNAC